MVLRKKVRRLLINSSNRNVTNFGTSTRFQQTISGFGFSGKSIAYLEKFTCMNTIYNIRDGLSPVVGGPPANNTFDLEEFGQPSAVVSIPYGSYNITQFTAALAAALNLVSPTLSTYTVTYNTIRGQLVISSTGPNFRFFFTTEGPFYEMGWYLSSSTPLNSPLYNNPITGPQLIHLNEPLTIYMFIKEFQNAVTNCFPQTIGGISYATNAHYVIPVTSNFGGIIDYTEFTDCSNGVQFSQEGQVELSYITVTLYDARNNIIDLNGTEISFVIRFEDYVDE